MAQDNFRIPSVACVAILITFFQSIYMESDVRRIFLSTRGIECATPCEMKDAQFHWCSLVTKSWDYCSQSPLVDYKGRKCEDKCGLHGHKYEWCSTEDGDWGYCSREGHQVLIKHFGSFEDKECASTCSKHGYKFYWCRMADSSWDYCSPKEGRNSGGTKCKSECGKSQDTKYQWCFDENEKWQYCSRVTSTALSSNRLVSPPKIHEKEFGRSSTIDKSSNRSSSTFANRQY